MTLVASAIFLSALAVSVSVIARTLGNTMPRIVEIIKAEVEPVELEQRRITFGVVRCRQTPSAEVIDLQRSIRVEREFQLAA